jgi:hypothetical protein
VGYIILEADDTLQLAAEVCKRMARGYRPLGGVACHYDPLRQAARYVQALVLDATSPAEPDATPDQARYLGSAQFVAHPRGPDR